MRPPCATTVSMTKKPSSQLALFIALLLAQLVYGHGSPQPKPKPVARVLTRQIFLKQIDPPADELRDAKRKYKPGEYQKWLLEYRADNLASAILSPLLRDYASAHGISATPDEINGFVRAVFADYPDKDKPDTREVIRTLARDGVIQWKVSRELYKQYGGPVIFQQANPYEPIGAYRKFLEEQEKKKTFEIFDPELRQAFWNYFADDHDAMPPNEINYDVPWWLQKPK